MIDCSLDSLYISHSLKIHLPSSSVWSFIFGSCLRASLDHSTVLNKYINNMNTLQGDQKHFLLALVTFR